MGGTILYFQTVLFYDFAKMVAYMAGARERQERGSDKSAGAARAVLECYKILFIGQKVNRPVLDGNRSKCKSG